ncbi:hypothetical protein HHI36_012223 [Cryptolaemus montrouzieri]|uniref:Uncharacterized protein n=1 Tax=Cryptolaemus montrouzieri TaxID=559131 RepID=A0ABD2NEG4_9CUCU
MMKAVLLLSAILANFYMAEAIECNFCIAAGRDDMKQCLNIDGSSKVVKCTTDESPYCFEMGVDHISKNGKKYSNQRGCGGETTCDFIKKDKRLNIRKCRVCSTDKCNNSTLTGN